MSKLIKLNQKNIHLAEVVLNRPDKLNAMTKPMWIQLGKVFKKLSKNKKLRCIIIRGEGGKSFPLEMTLESLRKKDLHQSLQKTMENICMEL